MGKNTYNLYLETDKGLISIPCGKIEDVDNYTMRFSNTAGLKNYELFLNVLIRMLDLNISIKNIKRVCLSTKYKKDYEFDYENCYPIKYGEDNYNLDSLIGNFASYLKENRNRLKMFEGAARGIINFYDEGTYTDDDINFFAKTYLNKSYRNHRDVYFLLRYGKEMGSIMIDKPLISRDMGVAPERLDKLDESDNEQIQYLIELASRDSESYERAIDELAMNDLEELNRYLGSSSRGIIDGISDLTIPNSEDIKLFEELIEKDLNELQSMCKEQLNRGRKR